MLRPFFAALLLFATGLQAVAADPVRVVVWDEQQPAQKQAYDKFLGNAIAGYLGKQPEIGVKSVRLDDPDQGLSAETLDSAQVLVWWGHVRNREVSAEKGREIVERIKAGKLSLIALHSAHWSTPFVEAMHERTRQDAARKFPAPVGGKVEFEYVPPPLAYTVPARFGDYAGVLRNQAERRRAARAGRSAELLLSGLPSRRQAEHDQGVEGRPPDRTGTAGDVRGSAYRNVQRPVPRSAC